MSQEFCRDVPDPWGCSKSLCKNKFVRILRSLVMVVLLPLAMAQVRTFFETTTTTAVEVLHAHLFTVCE